MSKSSSAFPNFSPPVFKTGLANFPSDDGIASSHSYVAVVKTAYAPNDSDFFGCL